MGVRFSRACLLEKRWPATPRAARFARTPGLRPLVASARGAIRGEIGRTPENTYLVKHINSNALNLYAHGINNCLDDHNIHSITKSERPQDKKQDTSTESPKTQFNTDGLFAGYDETQEFFSSTPSTVFNDLNRLEPEEFKPIRLSVFDTIDVNKDNIITLDYL